MLKRLLVALDRDHDSEVATQYAQEIGERFRAEITGLAVVNRQAVNAEIGPGGAVGAMHYAEQIRARRVREDRGLAYALADAFDETLNMTSIKHVEHVSDGVPYKKIGEEMKYNDLLVIGREPHFFFSKPTKKTNTLARIVKHGDLTPKHMAMPLGWDKYSLRKGQPELLSGGNTRGGALLHPFEDLLCIGNLPG